MSLVRCEPAVTQLMKQLKGDRLSMRRIRVIKPKTHACLVRGRLTPSLMTPIRQEREAGRSCNREIRNAKVEDGGGAPVVDICFLPIAPQRPEPCSPGRSPSVACRCPSPACCGRYGGRRHSALPLLPRDGRVFKQPSPAVGAKGGVALIGPVMGRYPLVSHP